MKTVVKVLTLALVTALILPAAALAKPLVKIAIAAEKVIVVTKNGKTETRRVPAGEAAPGETLIYTLAVTNSGDEAATNVVVNDPIPEGTQYIPGSATEMGELTFSIDGGNTYKKPSLLTYEVTKADGAKEKRVASPEQYTHIRWQIPEIVAGAKKELSFQVKVK